MVHAVVFFITVHLLTSHLKACSHKTPKAEEVARVEASACWLFTIKMTYSAKDGDWERRHTLGGTVFVSAVCVGFLSPRPSRCTLF